MATEAMNLADWKKLPLKLRQRYWHDTGYGQNPLSAELAAAIEAVLSETRDKK